MEQVLKAAGFTRQVAFANEDNVWTRGKHVVCLLCGWSIAEYTYDANGQIGGMIEGAEGRTASALKAALANLH